MRSTELESALAELNRLANKCEHAGEDPMLNPDYVLCLMRIQLLKNHITDNERRFREGWENLED